MKSFIPTLSSLHLHPYTFIILLTNLSLGFILPYLWDRRPSSLSYMQLTTPRLVPMAVRMVMSVWITSFQMSRFSIVFWFWFMICASSVTDFHPLATWVGIIFPTDNAKIQFCAPECQEAPPFWRRFNTSRACHSECSEESECASKSIILLMFTDSSVPSEWQEMEAPVCLQFLCRLTIAKSGFVRIIHVLCNKEERKGRTGGTQMQSQLSQITDNS